MPGSRAVLLASPPNWLAVGRTLGLAVGLAGCGPGRGAPHWIPAEAAVVQCTVSGKHRLAPVLTALPRPPIPLGLYARGLDPIALDDLGFQRNQPACASLIPATEAEIEAAGPSLDELLRVHRETGKTATAHGRACVCEIAGKLGAISLIRQCYGVATRKACPVTETEVETLRQDLLPLHDAAVAASIPLLHWRLSGITDRSGWFVRRQTKLIARYPLGSDIYPRDTLLPVSTDTALARAFLEAPDVQVVVQQNAGRALLVIREVGDELVFDHFSYPEMDGRQQGLVRYWESLHLEDFLGRLAAPSSGFEPAVDPRRGNLLELSIPGLERVDVSTVAASKISPRPYRLAQEERIEPAVMVDRVILQAPFGQDGRTLEGEIRLSVDGRQWAQLLAGAGVLTPTLDELSPEDPLSFAPADARNPPEFVLRGTPTNQAWVHGLRAVPRVLKTIEMWSPGTINGTLEDFELKLPDTFPTDLAIDPGQADLAAYFQTEAQILTGGFDNHRTKVLFTLAPR